MACAIHLHNCGLVLLLFKFEMNVKIFFNIYMNGGTSATPPQERRARPRSRIMRGFPAFRIVFKYGVIWLENP